MSRKKPASTRNRAGGRVTPPAERAADGVELSVRGAALTPVSGRADSSTRTVLVEPGYPDAWRLDLHNVRIRRQKLQARERELVAQALAAGATWSAIGHVLGMSRQSAHSRFRNLVPLVNADPASYLDGIAHRAEHSGSAD